MNAYKKAMQWLTKEALLQKLPLPNKWLTVENELYKDIGGNVYLVPRLYISDNYTIPDWIAWLCGNKSKFDGRASHIHDFGCQFHQLIKVTLTVDELLQMGFLEYKNGYYTCNDIPVEYLTLVSVTKWEIDCLFKRAMKATGFIPPMTYNLFRCGVFFNVGWLCKYSQFDLDKIYTIEQNGKEAEPLLKLVHIQQEEQKGELVELSLIRRNK